MKIISTNSLKQKVCLLSTQILMIHKVTMTFEILVQLLLRKEAATVEKSDFSQISGLLSIFLELNDKKNPPWLPGML